MVVYGAPRTLDDSGTLNLENLPPPARRGDLGAKQFQPIWPFHRRVRRPQFAMVFADVLVSTSSTPIFSDSGQYLEITAYPPLRAD